MLNLLVWSTRPRKDKDSTKVLEPSPPYQKNLTCEPGLKYKTALQPYFPWCATLSNKLEDNVIRSLQIIFCLDFVDFFALTLEQNMQNVC